jgi:hypothetical protein
MDESVVPGGEDAVRLAEQLGMGALVL